MLNRKLLGGATAAVTILIATQASAHTGPGPEATFSSGFVHPFSGLDHILAMIGVGLWGAQVGGKAVWQMPAAFLGALLVGAFLALSGAGLPIMELGVAGSVALLSLAILYSRRIPLPAGLALTGLFGLFHGSAHGIEMPLAGSTAMYVLGFVVATMLLHAVGIGIGSLGRRRAPALAPRALGAAGAITGILMLAALA